MRKHITRIEEEYGMSFMDVVRGFAEDGESRAAVANILGIPTSSFYAMVEPVRHWFKVGHDTNGARNALHPGNPHIASVNRYINPTYRWVMHKGTMDTLAGHARRVGIPIGRVRTRINRYPDAGPDYWLAKEKHVRPRRPTRDHPWVKASQRYMEKRGLK